MSIKRLLFVSSLSLLLTACAEFFANGQPPAPIYRGDLAKVTKPSVVIEPPVEIVKTTPLKEPSGQTKITKLKAEPLSLEQEQQLLEQDIKASTPAAAEITKPVEVPKEATVITPPPVVSEVIPPPPPPPPVPAFQPLESFAPASPVVSSLLVAANKNSDSGNIESATSTIERAIRIEPRNPTLFYKLALLRLKQSKPALAEDLAKKSALLATNNNQLKKHCWLLIARARELQNNSDGAKQARDMADKF